MEVPVHVEFRNFEASRSVREVIDAHVAALEARFGRITACRMVLKGPGGHHQNGGLYEVTIRLSLPDGREVNIGRTASADPRHADLRFAINDAFKRTRRRLQDQVRRLQGSIKQHEQQPTGIVKRLDPGGQFGFLESHDGREIYFHRNSVLNGGFARLAPGIRVAFREEPGEKGAQASTVRLTGKHAMRASMK